MSVFSTVTRTARRVVGDVQQSVRRAKLDGDLRVLRRQHRAALEQLGDRVVELVRAGELPGAAIGPELANVEAKLMEIDAATSTLDDGDDPQTDSHLPTAHES